MRTSRLIAIWLLSMTSLANAEPVLTLCLPALGNRLVLSPTSPVNMNGAIDSTLSARGPIFLDHDETVGQGETNINVLAQTAESELQTSTGIDLNVRANTIVVAASHGITDHLDFSLVFPIVEELVDVSITGPLTGHTNVTFAGASDLSARLKWNFRPHLAALLQASFPTGDSSHGLGTGDYFLSPGLAASTVMGPVQLNAKVAFNVNLSRANQSSITYGAGASMLLGVPWLGAAVEFLGESGTGEVDPLVLFAVDYAQRHEFALAFGLRAVLPYDFMVFVAGSYGLNKGGLRSTDVFPTIGIGGRF